MALGIAERRARQRESAGAGASKPEHSFQWVAVLATGFFSVLVLVRTVVVLSITLFRYERSHIVAALSDGWIWSTPAARSTAPEQRTGPMPLATPTCSVRWPCLALLQLVAPRNSGSKGQCTVGWLPATRTIRRSTQCS